MPSNIDLDLPPLAAGESVPEDLLDPQTLAAAARLVRAQAESGGDEIRALAASRLLCCLRVGPITEVADALIENLMEVIIAEDEED